MKAWRTVFGALLIGISQISIAQWAPLVPADEERRHGKMLRYEPDHLVPVSNLADDIGCVARFDYNPFFSEVTHWCLHQSDGAAEYSLLAWSSPSDGAGQYTPPDHIGVSIDADIAKSIHEIWLNALLQARFPRFDGAGLDGVSITFSARRYTSYEVLGGSTWSPQDDLPPRWLADLGYELYRFGSVPAGNMASLRRSVSETKAKIYAYYLRKGI